MSVTLCVNENKKYFANEEKNYMSKLSEWKNGKCKIFKLFNIYNQLINILDIKTKQNKNRKSDLVMRFR